MLVTNQCITLIEDNFQSEVLESKTLVLVDCWASWCRSSWYQGDPIFNELALEFAGQIKVARLNVANAEKLAARYGIRAVPTLLLFKDGQVLERTIGRVVKTAFKGKLSSILASANACGSGIA